MPERNELKPSDMEEILSAIPWRCFFCDFVTRDSHEAAAHFGCRDDAEEFKPLCKWWACMSENERAQTLQQYIRDKNEDERTISSQRAAIEGLEYQVESLVAQIRSYAPFRDCSSIYEVFCKFDSMEGRALAAEERLRAVEESA